MRVALQATAAAGVLAGALALAFGPLSGSLDLLAPDPAPIAIAGGIGDPQQGRVALLQYACVACHVVPGVTGPAANVGPPLGGAARRAYVAGVLRNSPENMMRWILDPQRIDPLTAMPSMSVAEQDARHIVAYLYTLR